jgi:chorismate dehydratase
MTQLRFGVLAYLNCLPATLGLEKGAVGGHDWTLRRGTPAELNRAMRDGELDVSLVSTAEFLDNEDRYTRLEEFSLWCDGPVESVCLFSNHTPGELGALTDGLIAVTPESASSVALTEILLPGCRTEPFASLEDARAGLKSGRYEALLLIGDRALEPPVWTRELKVHDLSQWWAEASGHPMTFAVWVARQGLDPGRLNDARSLLNRSVEWGEAHFETVLSEACHRSELSSDRLSRYLEGIHFRTTPASQAGFLEYRSRLMRHRVFGRPRTPTGTATRRRMKVTAL